MPDADLAALLRRIADALDRLAPVTPADAALTDADGFIWHAEDARLEAVPRINRLDLDLLKGIDQVRGILLENTRRFADGRPANNALLWGARGMGKSSLIKAVHARVLEERPKSLALIEIHREEIPSLPHLLARLRSASRRCILFCDDLSFEANDTTYKSLKAVLEGGIEGRPDNVVFYATSNRRHLMSRQAVENERSTALHPGEAVEESVSLSDRFGLWLGFHACTQETFLAMVDAYAAHFALTMDRAALHAEAIEWSMTRGARSGRVAWQFVQELLGRRGSAPPPEA